MTAQRKASGPRQLPPRIAANTARTNRNARLHGARADVQIIVEGLARLDPMLPIEPAVMRRLRLHCQLLARQLDEAQELNHALRFHHARAEDQRRPGPF